GGRGARRVGVEPARGATHPLEQRRAVAAQDVLLSRRLALDERGEAVVQHDDPALRLRVAARRVQTGEGPVADDLHYASSAMRFASAFRPSSRAAASARAQSGGVACSFGSGASGSIVAMWR